jgi:hypothetical protein
MAGTTRSGVETPSQMMDSWIRVREPLLAMLLPKGLDKPLNETARGETSLPHPDLAADLRRAMDEMIVSAIDSQGMSVDYEGLRTSPAYLGFRRECSARLGEFKPQSLPSEAARRAFWINLYNVLILDAVIAFGVQRSVTEGWLGVLTFFRRAAYNVSGSRMSLDDIEHGILRGNKGHPFIPGAQFAAGDERLSWSLPVVPRIHFALNCASLSCPPIQSYSPEQIDAQLDLAAHSFVDATVETSPDGSRVIVSEIFRWYADDFGGRQGVIDFLVRHLPEDDRRQILLDAGGSLRLGYTPYDWGLNNK